MIELNRASKRRLNNVDGNERIALRQTVLNMSICKLQKDQGRKEPSLLRSVLISNTVRNIEDEMDEELMNDYEEDSYLPYFYDQYKNEKFTNINNVNDSTKEIKQKENNPIKPNKYGAIGDHRRNKLSSEEILTNNSIAPVISGFLLDSMVFPKSFPLWENMEFGGTDFPNIDITLYDYDRNSPFSQQSNYTPDMFQGSCAVEYEKHKPDSFFDEIEQIMQVLVGI